MPRAKIQSQIYGGPEGRRTPRRPSHSFQLKVRPWQLVPFMLVPVLPGETLKNLLLQVRVVTDPIVHPLVGWWCEHYFFYVKHRDLDNRDSLTRMMIDPAFNPVTEPGFAATSAQPEWYQLNGRPSWVYWCLQRIVAEYFRYEGETPMQFTIGSYPIASVNAMGALDSLRLQSEYDALDTAVEGPDADTTIEGSEVETALARWQLLRFNNLTDMTYEEYLSSYGVRTADAELHVPELVRYTRDWQYPTNHVEATTGVPSSALSWKVAERADKDRYFSEPGFLVGVQCVRPKVYMGNVKGSVAGLMNTAMTWLPSVLTGQGSHSLVQCAIGDTGPVSTPTTPYSIDVRDLLLYGEQFTNFDTQALGVNSAVNLPQASTQKRYAFAADADGLFKAPAANLIRSDGRVDLTILGRQSDQTATS